MNYLLWFLFIVGQYYAIKTIVCKLTGEYLPNVPTYHMLVGMWAAYLLFFKGY